MAERKTRGSSKMGDMSPEHLMSAVSGARENFVIERWWKYGTPAIIDLITGTINVRNVADAVEPPRFERTEMRALESSDVVELLKATEGTDLQAVIAVAVGAEGASRWRT